MYVCTADLFIDVEHSQVDLENVQLTFAYAEIVGNQQDEQQVLSVLDKWFSILVESLKTGTQTYRFCQL